jgi:hypothetical protein
VKDITPTITKAILGICLARNTSLASNGNN